ncbi:MAG: ankyrin repeat domain-containing protein [Candidatus Thorarchaeota archaeon]
MTEANEQLLKAAEAGDLEAVKAAIEQGADISTTDEWMKQTALHKASSQGHIEIVEYLVEKGADVLKMDGVDMTPLHLAARDGRTRVAKFLLNTSVQIPERILNDAMHVGTMSVTGNPDIVKMIEDYRVKMATPSTSGRGDADSQLQDAAHDGDLEGVRSAITNGADVEVIDGRGMKAIHWAALRGHKDIVGLLLENGADANGKNSADWTPIMHASMEGHIEIVKMLLDKSADINAQTFVAGTALMFASGNGHKEVVKLLLSAGADPRMEISGSDGEDGTTAIDYAWRSGHMTIANLLLEAREALDEAE